MTPYAYHRADSNRHAATLLKSLVELNESLERHGAFSNRILEGLPGVGDREMIELRDMIKGYHSRLRQLIKEQIARLDKEFEAL